jgi:hypothetical protein
MNSVLKVDKCSLKLLILGWVVVYDKYKTTFVSDPRHEDTKKMSVQVNGLEEIIIFSSPSYTIATIMNLREIPSLTIYKL